MEDKSLETMVASRDVNTRKAAAQKAAQAGRWDLLEKLANDEVFAVRAIIAEQGYALDKLADDPAAFVRIAALRKKGAPISDIQNILNAADDTKISRVEIKDEPENHSRKTLTTAKRKKSSFTPEQQEAFDALVAGKSVFLTGDAGTGKSYVLNKFIDYLDDHEIEHIALAPTGVAALNICGGSTIHRTLRLPFGFLDADDGRKAPPKVLCAAKTIVIDEISMCRIDLFERVMRLISKAERQSGTKQLVVVGDFFQLPPVVTRDDEELMMRFYPGNSAGWCFKSVWWTGRAFEPHVLKKVVRQNDPEFISNLDRARKGDKSCIEYFNRNAKSSWKTVKADKDTVFLSNTNQLAQNINMQKMSELGNEIEVFWAEEDGKVNKGDKIAEEKLQLCEGAKVMMLVNDKQGRFVNGSQGEVVEIDRKENTIYVHVFDSDEEVAIEPHTWKVLRSVAVASKDPKTGEEKFSVENETVGSYTQYPLKLAYAITIHKSQGLTFPKVALNTSTFAEGQLYVGLSRCSTFEGLSVFPKIEPSRLHASREVVNFYDSLEREMEKRRQENTNDMTSTALPPTNSMPSASLDMVVLECPRELVERVTEYIDFLKTRRNIEAA